MAYQIDRYNNTTLTVVEDGTVDQTTDLKFIGKNYAGYGEIQNENFLFLLENFSGANAPPRAISGQLWFDSGNSKLKFYDGEQWRTTGGSAVATAEPTGLTDGDFWWDSANDQLYVFNGTDYILIGPQNAGEGVTQMISRELLDSSNATKSVITATIQDEVIAIISPSEFTLNNTNPIVGFDRIKKGVTLAWTKLADNGVTNSAEVAGKDFNFWGTASNAEKLGGVPASSYVTTVPGETTVFTTIVQFPDDGVAVGDSLDFKFYVENGDEGIIENQTGLGSEIKFKTTNGTGTATHSITINSTGLIPAADNVFNIGASGLKFNTVYASLFDGEATKAATLRVGTNNWLGASTSAAPNTIAARTGDGNIAANLFQGTATAARYADLAEKYTTDKEYPVGTVMAVGGEAETRAAKISDIAIGVISENPAIMMNSDAEGQYIGLKGRVPVRVVGPVSKGMPVYAYQDGVASTLASNGLVGIALETNNAEGEKLVECVLKV